MDSVDFQQHRAVTPTDCNFITFFYHNIIIKLLIFLFFRKFLLICHILLNWCSGISKLISSENSKAPRIWCKLKVVSMYIYITEVMPSSYEMSKYRDVSFRFTLQISFSSLKVLCVSAHHTDHPNQSKVVTTKTLKSGLRVQSLF